jgi:hypothetical protein
MTPLHMHKDLIKMNIKIKMNTKIKSKRRAMIRGRWGDENDRDKGEGPPHPRVHHNVQRDHPVDNILGDIKKG